MNSKTTSLAKGMSDMEMIEKVARALCELDIRTKRRFDTPSDELEAMIPGAIDYAWTDYVSQAEAAVTAYNPDERLSWRELIDQLSMLHSGKQCPGVNCALCKNLIHLTWNFDAQDREALSHTIPID